MLHIFTYGSLMYPDIWTAVTGSQACAKLATASGVQRFRVRGAVYPGLVRTSNASHCCEGQVYCDVSRYALSRLDDFEGPEYRRGPIALTLDDGRALDAHAYYWCDSVRLLAQDWSPDIFNARHRRGFAKRHRRE